MFMMTKRFVSSNMLQIFDIRRHQLLIAMKWQKILTRHRTWESSKSLFELFEKVKSARRSHRKANLCVSNSDDLLLFWNETEELK